MPSDDKTVVFTAYFDAGLRFPCYDLVPEVLALFKLELPQLSPSAFVRSRRVTDDCSCGRSEDCGHASSGVRPRAV
ncbi:hypothetical protein E2562_013558 [Oryza meyeriana var. granulata]|uniref:Uncharacterized protein n=1 Tax=Oryza meyeriana var. granulata TaxID=110450 RepID=A0A6G1D3K6_9ORYZ|nr:hypothetical protein E2562_013558 [Oryza meyeriana var. granulata]